MMPFTLSASEVVGRPISVLRVRLSSNSPPFDAPVSESASISARPGRQADAFQRGGEIGFAEVLINHIFPALLAQLCSQFAQGPGVITRQFVNFPGMTLTGNNVSGGGGIIRTGGGGDFTLPGGADKHAVLQRRRRAGQIVFGIPAVTQQGVSEYRSQPASVRFRYAQRPGPAARCRHAAGWYRR